MGRRSGRAGGDTYADAIRPGVWRGLFLLPVKILPRRGQLGNPQRSIFCVPLSWAFNPLVAGHK